MNQLDVFDNPPIFLPPPVLNKLEKIDLQVRYAATFWDTDLYTSSTQLTIVLGQSVRTALNAERFYIGDLLGTFGGGTKKAVKCLQRTYGLKADGIKSVSDSTTSCV
jgi:peptidoglycan hydrolase-like protein with peptidoglycan-binding domain